MNKYRGKWHSSKTSSKLSIDTVPPKHQASNCHNAAVEYGFVYVPKRVAMFLKFPMFKRE